MGRKNIVEKKQKVFKNNNARENAVMMALLTILQSSGGKIDKKAARKQIPLVDDRIHDEDIWEEKVSKKSGRTYRPFDFTLNYAAKRLELFGALEDLRGKNFVLTEKGLALGLSEATPDGIRLVTDPIIKETSDKNKKKKAAQIKSSKEEQKDDEIENDDSENIDETVEGWRKELKVQLRQMDPAKFERFSRRLIKEMGAQIDDEIGVQLSQDHGLDGYAYFVSDELRTTRVAIQSKRYNNLVGDKYVRDFRGSIQNGTDYGILITTDYFSDAAVKEAKDPSKSTPITLLDLDDVIDLVEKYQLFIKKVETYELGDFYFD